MNGELETRLAAQAEVASRRQILATGVLAHELAALHRRDTWPRMRRGIYTRSEPDGWLTRLVAAHLALGQRAVVSHESAARLHGLPLFVEDRVSRLTLAPGGGTGHRRYAGVVVHKAGLPATHVVQVEGLPVTSPERTVVDIARTRSRRSALIPLDAALHIGALTPRQLAQVVADCAGWPGIHGARVLVAFADRRSESPLESLSRLLFADQSLPMPTPQVVVRAGGWTARADFLWEAEGVIGEADGLGKYADLADLRAEKLREDRLRDLGFEVVRFTWDDVVRRAPATATRIRVALARGARRRALAG